MTIGELFTFDRACRKLLRFLPNRDCHGKVIAESIAIDIFLNISLGQPKADRSFACFCADHRRLLILADGGGSNGVRCRAWKAFIQTRLADRYRIPVTVCHYQPGTSKWNPIEHRLFSEISKNWSGQPLDSYETIVKYIRSTKTTTGLRVRASLVKKTYEKGIKISKAQFEALSIKRHDTLSQWNYTLSPR